MMTSNNIPEILAPDLIIKNGTVLTVDKDFTKARAVAVKDGKIVAVGTNDEVEALRGAKTQTLDLQGAALMPGIIDSHMHVALTITGDEPFQYDLNYPKVQSIEDLRDVIRYAVSKSKPGQWIFGAGWNQGVIKELIEDNERRLCKTDLDDVAPDNPLWLQEFSRHNSVVNTAALKAAGITRDTPDPENGRIIRDANGEPTGFMEEKANELIERAMPKHPLEVMKKAFFENIDKITKYGITSVITASERPEDVMLYSEVYREIFKSGGTYPLRINILMLWSDYFIGGDLEDIQAALKYVGTTTNFGSRWLRIAGIKQFADGIPPTKTAWASRPYADGSHGSLVVHGATDADKVQRIADIAEICHKNGFQMASHTCGDLAVDAVVKGIAKAIDKYGNKDLRHYVIHGDWVLPETMEIMAKYKIPISTQSELKIVLTDDTIQRMGVEVAGEQWPLKEMLDKGILVCNGSDCPAGDIDWRPGVQAAVLRESLTGVVSGPHQALTVEEAIRTYTNNPAWLNHMEHLAGSIEVGKLADFCVTGQDITAIDPHEIVNTPIHMTIVGGRVVYSDDKLHIS